MAEDHRRGTAPQARFYIKSDSKRPRLTEVEGSHTLERFINGVRGTWKTETQAAVWEAPCNSGASRTPRLMDPADRQEAAASDLPIGALGSGSDYTVFLDHLGIASLNWARRRGRRRHLPLIYDDSTGTRIFRIRISVYGRALAQRGTAVMPPGGRRLAALHLTTPIPSRRSSRECIQVWPRRSGSRSLERNRQIDEGVVCRHGRSAGRRPCPPEGSGSAFLTSRRLGNGLAAGLEAPTPALRPGAGPGRGRTEAPRWPARPWDANARLIAVRAAHAR